MAPPIPPAPEPGDAPPALRLPTIDGEEFVLAERDHKIALVTFLRHAG